MGPLSSIITRPCFVMASSIGRLSAPVAVGIDFGTTQCSVAFWDKSSSKVKVVRYTIDTLSDKLQTVPSVVFFHSDESRGVMVGHDAISASVESVGTLITNIKRLLGTHFSSKEVQQSSKRLSYDIACSNSNAEVMCVIKRPLGSASSQMVSCVSVASYIFSVCKQMAESKMQRLCSGAVITVPSHYDSHRRAATKAAAEAAGLSVLGMMTESTAAALAYGLSLVGKKTIVVFDFGGGTLDVSLLSVNEGEVNVLSTRGDPHLGGEDLTSILVEYVSRDIDKKRYIRVVDKKDSLLEIRKQCEKAKCLLSTVESVVAVHLPSGVVGEAPYECSITKKLFEQLGNSIFVRCLTCVKQALSDVVMDPREVDEIVLVGGSSRIPKVQTILREYFNGKELCFNLDPETAVASGAAIQAALLTGLDSEHLKSVKVFDVLPYSVGLADGDGTMHVVIPCNSRLPIEKTIIFETAVAGQPAVTVKLYKGDALKAIDNEFIGEWDFPIVDGAKAAAGERQVAIKFFTDQGGDLMVSAKTVGFDGEGTLSWKGTIILIGYIIVLLGIYVSLKMGLLSDYVPPVPSDLSYNRFPS